MSAFTTFKTITRSNPTHPCYHYLHEVNIEDCLHDCGMVTPVTSLAHPDREPRCLPPVTTGRSAGRVRRNDNKMFIVNLRNYRKLTFGDSLNGARDCNSLFTVSVSQSLINSSKTHFSSSIFLQTRRDDLFSSN